MFMQFFNILTLIITLVTASLLPGFIWANEAALSQPRTVTHPTIDNQQDALIREVLHLAIKKSGRGHLYALSETSAKDANNQKAHVLSGQMEVMWAGSQKTLNQDLRPIKIPVLKGLLGHRIFIIHEEKQAVFDRIQSLEDLKHMSAGQARFASDTDILKSANMKVIDPVKRKSLLPMLEGGRFDFSPRALFDPWSEIEQHENLPLAVEKNLMLVYPYAMYFYVAKANTELHQVIETGFRIAIEDGSFDQLFFNHELVKTAFEKSNFKSRKVFRIQNPEISATTYQQDSKLWLNVENL